MPFCTNCGKKIADDAKFCVNCGVNVNKTESDSDGKRKTVYEGEIHKCPNCGEVLNSFVYICSTCGYELRDSKLSKSMREFTQQLINSNNEDKSVALIRNFPIPNTKEDIFEFMILASTNILGDIPKKISEAWEVKFEQCYQKSKLLFLNDDECFSIQKIYDDTTKKINKVKVYQGVKTTGNTLVKVGKILSEFALFVFKNILVLLGVIACIKSIFMDNAGDDGSGFELIGGVLLITASVILIIRKCSFLEIAFTACCGILCFYLSKFLDNGSAIQLFSAVMLVLVFVSFIRKSVSCK